MELENGVLNVGILIFDEVEVLDFCGPFEVFSVAGRLNLPDPMDDSGATTRVFLIAESDRPIRARGGLKVVPDYIFANHPGIDLLVVPGGWGTRKEVNNPILIDWLSRVSGSTQLNSSVCTGSFLLGKVGLLEGKRATTHWSSLDRMQASYPSVKVEREVRWVDEGEVVTSAGISAGIDMSLHLVERVFGRDTALATAHHMEYEWHEVKIN
jgi:transcriptional regulator GlxA family with amidase domain